MLPALLNIPHDENDWYQFAWAHRDSHDRIRAAILKLKGVNLTDFQVEPINPGNTQQFLQNNASLHTDMNDVLGSQSTNIEDVNLEDQRELQAWIALHYQEHLNAEQLLGI